MGKRILAVMAVVGLGACGTYVGYAEPGDARPAAPDGPGVVEVPDPQQLWWERMQALCGRAFAGEMVRYDEAMDAGWLNRPVIMHVRECSPTEIRIPLHVGENRSRTWVLTRTDRGIRLKHDHRYPDGTEEASTQYGGDTADRGTAYRQEFPADAYSKALFEAQDHPDGVHNIWIMEIHPGERFTYNLTRFNRDFAADFDLTRPVDLPPAPWAVEPRASANGRDP
jgi:hypothetical protein